MRVLIINSFFSVGGPPRIVKGIYDTLIDQGHECLLAGAREKQIPGMNTVRVGNILSPYICAIKSRIFDSEGFNAYAATKRLTKVIDEYKPDVINLHNLHGYFINIEVLFNYIKEKKIPVVWTLHDCWPITGHCTHFEFAKCNKWKEGGCSSCPQKKEYPTSNLLDASQKNFKRKQAAFTSLDSDKMTIVTPSHWMANYIEQSFLNKYPIKVIHNGIDLNVFKPTDGTFRKDYEIEDKKIVLGVAQNWAEKKGLEDFVTISQNLDSSYQVVLVGLTEEQKKELPDNIIGIQRTNSVEQLVDIYSAADVFVNCTYQDNFPTVNIEALACGTPVITYATGGSPEAVDNNSGIVVSTGNVDEIISILNNSIDITKDNCVARARSFEKQVKYNNYINVFTQMKLNV